MKLLINLFILSTFLLANQIKIQKVEDIYKIFYNHKLIDIEIDQQNEESFILSLVDINDDQLDEILMTYSSNGNVNITNRLFVYNKTYNKFEEIGKSYFLSNLTKNGKHLVSSYRNAARWYEEVYNYNEKNNSLVSLFKDTEFNSSYFIRECDDGNKFIVSKNNNIFNRTLLKFQLKDSFNKSFNASNIKIDNNKVLVNKDNSQWIPLSSLKLIDSDKRYICVNNFKTIQSQNQPLYKTPPEKTKMYLIKGDKVEILEEKDDWLYILYRGKKDIKAWIPKNAVQEQEIKQPVNNIKNENTLKIKQNTSKIESIKKEEKTFFTKLLELFGSSIPNKNIMQS